jgi:nitroimidazol reductase NimA-like FMN-containing flavoprotein (pyridoxamine 5'-phosphate oxidase superfamily)
LTEQIIPHGGRPIRRITKEITDIHEIEACLQIVRVGYLGLHDEEGCYVVPLNFVWHNGSLYFHGSHEGRKYDAIQQQKTLSCFTVAEDWGTIADPVPAHTGTAYRSVMVFGYPEQVQSLAEATDALQAMLEKYVPGYYPATLASAHVEKYRSRLGSPTAVYKITPVRLTGKTDPIQPERMFYPGRTQHTDLKA